MHKQSSLIDYATDISLSVTSDQNVEAEKAGNKATRGGGRGGLTCIMDLQLQCITVCRYLQTV